MKSYAAQDIRNLALIGHQGVGKTTLAEAILFRTGAIGRMGSVDDGSSNLDYHVAEIERKTSIYSALGACEHEKTKFNMIDTPGFEDFRGEVISALSVVESAVMVVRADSGVEVGTAALWEIVEDMELPAVFVIAKMDKEHADYDKAFAQIKERLHPKAVAMQLPIGSGEDFHGLVDVATGTAYSYQKPGEPEEIPIPDDMQAAYEAAREELLNAAAEHDDALVEKFLEEGTLTYEEIVKGTQIGVREKTFFPVCLASAQSGIGMRQILHTIKETLPAAADRKPAKLLQGETVTEVPVGGESPNLARIFKVSLEKDAGDLALMRVFSGEVATGHELHNANTGNMERVSQLFSLEGKNREKIDRIGAGDFGAAVKLKDSHAGNTIGDKDLPGVFRDMAFPAPNSRVALRPVKQGEDDKMAQGMARIHEEDQTFHFGMDPETHEMVLEAQGELHMDVLLERLDRRFGCEVSRHEPRIPYLETIKSKVEVHARHKKQSGGRGQFADIHVRFEPLARGGNFEFVDAIVGGAVPSKFIPAVEKGLVESMDKGPLAGYRVVDVKATLFDGQYHNVDSSEQAFKTAAHLALKDAFGQAKSVMLEPIYLVEVKCPEDVMGDVMGDLSSRRGRIMGTEAVGHLQVVKAQVPLSELYRYSTSLRSMSQGRATHSREFLQYEEVPADQMGKVIEKSKAEAEEA